MPAHAKGGFDFVVIGRKTTLRRPFPALVADLVSALRNLEAYAAGKGGTASGESS
jgi:ribonuclease P protein component